MANNNKNFCVLNLDFHTNNQVLCLFKKLQIPVGHPVESAIISRV